MSDNYGIQYMTKRLDEIHEIISDLSRCSGGDDLHENGDYVLLQQKASDLLQVIVAFEESTDLMHFPEVSITYKPNNTTLAITGELIKQTAFGYLVRIDAFHERYIRNLHVKDVKFIRDGNSKQAAS